MSRILNGSCACGRVRYEIRGALIGPITYCHCWRCRKHSGSSFGTTGPIRAEDLHFVAGEELLSAWESSPGTHRLFAGCCGAPIYKRNEEIPGALGLRLGTLDTDPGQPAGMHFMVGSKVPWLTIDDGLRQEGEGVPFGGRD